jgi:hypothetical protein
MKGIMNSIKFKADVNIGKAIIDYFALCPLRLAAKGRVPLMEERIKIWDVYLIYHGRAELKELLKRSSVHT